MRLVLSLLLIWATPSFGEAVLAARNIRAQAVLTPQDIALAEVEIPGAFDNPDQVLGQEARVMLYAGRPIRPGDLGPPALIERNAIVPILFRRGPLTISAEGRALGRAAIGETVRVMNLASRNTITGRVARDGSILVGDTLP